MNRTESLFITCVLLLACVTPALAQQAMKPAVQTAQAKSATDPAIEAFKAWDTDHNGNLSAVEFRAGWQQVQRIAEMQARLRHQFATVDTNKNNAIDPAEYGNLLLVKDAGKTAPQMSTFDANKDGKLGFGEYVRLVQTLAPQDAKGKAK